MTERQVRNALRTFERMLKRALKERDEARAELKRLKKSMGKHGKN